MPAGAMSRFRLATKFGSAAPTPTAAAPAPTAVSASVETTPPVRLRTITWFSTGFTTTALCMLVKMKLFGGGAT
jgi:hypothetical protein